MPCWGRCEPWDRRALRSNREFRVRISVFKIIHDTAGFDWKPGLIPVRYAPLAGAPSFFRMPGNRQSASRGRDPSSLKAHPTHHPTFRSALSMLHAMPARSGPVAARRGAVAVLTTTRLLCRSALSCRVVCFSRFSPAHCRIHGRISPLCHHHMLAICRAHANPLRSARRYARSRAPPVERDCCRRWWVAAPGRRSL